MAFSSASLSWSFDGPASACKSAAVVGEGIRHASSLALRVGVRLARVAVGVGERGNRCGGVGADVDGDDYAAGSRLEAGTGRVRGPFRKRPGQV